MSTSDDRVRWVEEALQTRLWDRSKKALDAILKRPPHEIHPQYLAMYHRYQCRICKVFISYSEETGRWSHDGQ
jgi:hypothetical protein